MRTISYQTYLDKITGCFIGKAVSGNIGAPHEGVKMPMDFAFRPDMIDCSRPNDDLDLQILWLDTVERFGEAFTSYDLLERFVTHCNYNPGEYAVMRKNFNRGVYPPYSGAFDNDFFREGMGCPIRSEVWACLAAGNPELAASFASRDGVLDHAGASVEAERFLAALEAEAFFCDDVHTLIAGALKVVDPDSRFRRLVTDTVGWCDRFGDSKTVLAKILAHYGHPDCTNMYQNLGITLTALLLGENDILKTSLLALNCGHDTDCTCATAGAVIGLLRGADELVKAYGLTEVTYKLAVRSDRRSDKITDLAEDIASLGVAFTHRCNHLLTVADAPEKTFDFEEKPLLAIAADYPDGPSITLGETKSVDLTFTNREEKAVTLAVTLDAPNGLETSLAAFTLRVGAGESETVTVGFTLPLATLYVFDTNKIAVTATDEENETVTEFAFGLVGVRPYKLAGPFWRTDPVCNTDMILEHFADRYPYDAVIEKAFNDGVPGFTGSVLDLRREFHLNRAVDTETAFITEDDLFRPLTEDFASPDHDERLADVPGYRIDLSAHTGMRGPCVLYYALILYAPADMTVGMQIGHSSPFSLAVNGKTVAERKNFDYFTGENVHLAAVDLKKGDNRLVLRCVKKEATDKIGLILSKGACMNEHYTCFAYKNPYRW